MGLIYSSNDSNNLMNGLQTNIENAKDATEALNSGSQQVISAVSSGSLSGAAYSAGQGLFSELIIPTISKVTTSFKDMTDDLTKYKSANGSISSESYLNEDQLERQIKIKQTLLTSCEASLGILSHMESPPTGIITNLKNMSLDLIKDINDIKEKLTKLHHFSSQTSGLFSNSLSNLKIAMQGVVILDNLIVFDDGSYVLPEGFDVSWFDTLKDMSPKEMKLTIAINKGMEGLNLSEEGKKYYKKKMKELLKEVDPDKYESTVMDITKNMTFDEEGNILELEVTSLLAKITDKVGSNDFKILKNGQFDLELTGQAIKEMSDEEWEQFKENLPKILYGAAKTLLGLGILGVDGAATYMSGGALAAVGVSEAGAAFGGALTLTGGATLVDGLGLWNLSATDIMFSFAQNYDGRIDLQLFAKKSDIKQVNDAAKQLKMTEAQRIEFGDYIEEMKKEVGKPNNENFSWKELIEYGKQILEWYK